MLDNQNFYMYAGDTHHIQSEVTDSAGTPYNLRKAYLEWRLFPQGNPRFMDKYKPLVVKSSALGQIEVLNAELGEMLVKIEPEDTEGLKGQYYHEAILIEDSGVKITVFSGIVHMM